MSKTSTRTETTLAVPLLTGQPAPVLAFSGQGRRRRNPKLSPALKSHLEVMLSLEREYPRAIERVASLARIYAEKHPPGSAAAKEERERQREERYQQTGDLQAWLDDLNEQYRR